MTTALALTGLMAMGLNFLAISNGALTPIGEIFFLSPLKWVLMLAPLGMVFYLSAKLNSISAEKARNLFYWKCEVVMGKRLRKRQLIIGQPHCKHNRVFRRKISFHCCIWHHLAAALYRDY